MVPGWLHLWMQRNWGHRGQAINYTRINACTVHGLTVYHFMYKIHKITFSQWNSILKIFPPWHTEYLTLSFLPLYHFLDERGMNCSDECMQTHQLTLALVTREGIYLHKVGTGWIKQACYLTSSTRASPFFNHR